MRITGILPLTAAALLLLAGCAAPTTGAPPADAPDVSADLTVADSDLGQIVVDGTGMTVYFFDKDTAGATSSACTGQCASLWPAVHPSSTTPAVDGISAEVGTITGTDGQPQLTLDGRPVYTYASDTAPGDVNGQGFGDLWYVVGPDGTEITAAAGDGSGY